jgi:hypothetical protein
MSKFNINKDKIIEKIKSEKIRYIGIAAGIIMVAATSTGLVASMKMDKPENNVVAEDEIVDVVSEIMTETIPDATDATVGTTVTSRVTTTKNVVTTSLLTTLVSTAGMTDAPTIITTTTLPVPKPAPKQVEKVDEPTTTETSTVTESTTTETAVVTTTVAETTAVEETTATTTASEPEANNGEYTVYKPSTCYVHRNTCHWVTDECYKIDSTEGLACRYCTECNPDIEIVTAWQAPTPTLTSLQYVTEEERIYLCNTVAYEYGSDWVPLYDKACVVATVMNRVRDGGWTNGLPSTVYNVLTAPYQYNPVYATPYYSYNVTQSCIDAVEYYFEHQNEFPHYTSFWGDGRYNYFR